MPRSSPNNRTLKNECQYSLEFCWWPGPKPFPGSFFITKHETLFTHILSFSTFPTMQPTGQKILDSLPVNLQLGQTKDLGFEAMVCRTNLTSIPQLNTAQWAQLVHRMSGYLRNDWKHKYLSKRLCQQNASLQQDLSKQASHQAKRTMVCTIL